MSYDHKEIEKKWQQRWEESELYKAVEDKTKKKYYALIEFPYPSGAGLHVGHPRPYIGLDVVARMRRMQGYSVIYPIGWDAFGLPTENYAIKTGRKPQDITKENTDTFRRQIKSLGVSFDWSREINTTDPSYYKWTQWLFLQFLKHDLAYKAKTLINWCPKDKIGLANEEVVDGKCERCGTVVEKREKEQWMLAITKYADRLYADLDTVDYIERAKVQQRNWIGPSEGAEIVFQLSGISGQEDGKHSVTVFTTRPDTIFGATFLVISPELATKWINVGWQTSDEVRKYVADALKRRMVVSHEENPEKTGVAAGIFATNPATKEQIPVWVSDYVLGDVGTGALMAVPAHDERDYDFAKQFNLPIKYVIEVPENSSEKVTGAFLETKKGTFLFQERDENAPTSPNTFSIFGGSKESGESGHEGLKRELLEELELSVSDAQIVRIGYRESQTVPGKLCGMFLVTGVDPAATVLHEGRSIQEMNFTDFISNPRSNPSVTDFLKKNNINLDTVVLVEEGTLINSGKFSGISSAEAKKKITEALGGTWKKTYKLRDWVFSRQRYWGEPIPVVHCEKDGIVPLPEESLPLTLPEVENYQPTDTGESPLASIADWVNTTCPKCGGPAKRETDTMPNWAGSSWYYLRYTDPHNDIAFASPERLNYWTPVDWYNGGMEHTVLHLLYSRFWHKFLFDLGLVPTSEPYAKRTSHGVILAEGGEKMSKSKGNVVNPDDIVETVGADSLRVYEMFMGPFDQAIAWSTDNLVGARRFLERVMRLKDKVGDAALSNELEVLLNQTIEKVGKDIEELKMNTAVSSLMILLNAFEKEEVIPQSAFQIFVQMLAPFAPHIAEELWTSLGNEYSVHTSSWPVFDVSKTVLDTVTIVIQVNGKRRGEISVKRGSNEDDVWTEAEKNPNIRQILADKEVKKRIFVPDKLLNLVV